MRILKNFSVLLFFLISVTHTIAQTFPAKPSTLVNDYTNTLSEAEKRALESKLVAFDDSTSTQIAVVLINSLEGYDVADYTVRLAENWGIGTGKKNNGIILLASLGDRKVSIQTGYGVEGALPDAIARRIIENEIKPGFKNGDYYAGLDAGTNAIIQYTKGEYVNDNPKKKEKSRGVPIGFIILVIVFVLIASRGGGGGKNGGSIIGGRGSASPFWWMLMGSALGSSGRHGGGSWGGGGGSWGGGSGGGGGFGGFGGGSFGGGGASGSW